MAFVCMEYSSKFLSDSSFLFLVKRLTTIIVTVEIMNAGSSS